MVVCELTCRLESSDLLPSLENAKVQENAEVQENAKVLENAVIMKVQVTSEVFKYQNNWINLRLHFLRKEVEYSH